MKKLLLAAFCILIITGCGSGLEGTYSDKDGVMTVIFDGDDHCSVTVKNMGIEDTKTFEYKMDGNKIKFSNGSETKFIPINDDGSIVIMGITLAKKK